MFNDHRNAYFLVLSTQIPILLKSHSNWRTHGSSKWLSGLLGAFGEVLPQQRGAGGVGASAHSAAGGGIDGPADRGQCDARGRGPIHLHH